MQPTLPLYPSIWPACTSISLIALRPHPPHPRHFSETRCQVASGLRRAPRSRSVCDRFFLYAEGMWSKKGPMWSRSSDNQVDHLKSPTFGDESLCISTSVRATACTRGGKRELKGSSECIFCQMSCANLKEKKKKHILRNKEIKWHVSIMFGKMRLRVVIPE